ncbi:hypothetical protein FD755_014029, partial [Muntiacus reevesi]
GGGGSSGGCGSLQKRRVHVAVKYDRLELQLSLDVEKWIDGRLEESSAGSQIMRDLLKSCMNPTEGFIQELLVKPRGLHKQPAFHQLSPFGGGNLSPSRTEPGRRRPDLLQPP